MERFPQYEVNASGSVLSAKDKYDRLVKAVKELYNSAYWTPDRDVPNSPQLWEELRDAAGITPGNSPKPIKNFNDTLITETENGR